MSRTRLIFARRHLPVLARFAMSNVLLAFDYDGTLAPIAPSPGRARMRPGTRRLLARVAACYPCVVISGRTLADVTRRLTPIPLWYVFGNHGLEPAAGLAPYVEQTREWVRRLRRHLPVDPGIVVEDKQHSVTIHYRHARDRARALAAINQLVPTLRHARAIGGAEAINLLPRKGPHKGVALRRALRLFDCEAAIYVGDDGTDEDAFSAGDPGQVLGIRVGPSASSRARYHLPSQQDIDQLLELLLSLRVPRFAERRR